MARVCPDPELRRDVLSFLACEPESAGYLEAFVESLAAKRPEPPDLAGKHIGAWRLLRPLGRGGMGLVYEAERVDGAYEQRSALKLLTTALVGTEAYERFLGERQILAGLEHPAIARIVDGGVTEDGTPWFAMEHVEGEPIDAYCDRRRLGIRERLELILQVCTAVEHAHRRLVVHRDLKPANVLVTEERQVKLLDFGIAKLLDAEGAAQAAPPTRTALRMMTPEYASPEQVRGAAVTTASDVYQLGLLLYELLTGHRPYVLGHRGAGELERVICEQAPTRLSSVILREETVKPSTGVSPSTVEEVCRLRRSSPARLRRRLRGDLETIVLKALRKEPDRRYGSADRLAEDIRRHLAGLPVTARPDTWIYRGRKFLGRHALGASATAAGLFLATGLTAFYMIRIQGERDRAEAALDRVQAEAAKAQQVGEFLTGLFRSADPREARGAELTARELLDRGVEQVDRELAAQPEIQANMLRVLGRTYLELDVYDRAESLLTRALELHRQVLGENHPEVAKTLRNLSSLRSRRGEYTRAREHLEDAVRILETSVGADAPGLADVLSALGSAYRQLGEHDKSQAALERALAIQRRASGEDSEPVASILLNLGALMYETGDLERAEGLLERSLAIHERELGTDHPRVGLLLVDLAVVRAVQGTLDGVEPMIRRSLAILQKAYGPDHARVGMVLNNLGHFLTDSGRHEEAVEVLQRALEVYNTAVGPNHPEVAHPLASLGSAHLAGGRLREARDFYQRSVAVRDKAVGARQFDPAMVGSLMRLSRIEAELGNRAAAEQILNRVLATWREAPEAVDRELASRLLDFGRWLADQQRCTEAVPLLQRAMQVERTRQAPAGPQVAELESLLVGCSAE